MNTLLYKRKRSSSISTKNSSEAECEFEAEDLQRNTGRWSLTEHFNLLYASLLYNFDWHKVRLVIKGRKGNQIKSHWTQFKKKISKKCKNWEENLIPNEISTESIKKYKKLQNYVDAKRRVVAQNFEIFMRNSIQKVEKFVYLCYDLNSILLKLQNKIDLKLYSSIEEKQYENIVGFMKENSITFDTGFRITM
jgi:hypothetical protein